MSKNYDFFSLVMIELQQFTLEFTQVHDFTGTKKGSVRLTPSLSLRSHWGCYIQKAACIYKLYAYGTLNTFIVGPTVKWPGDEMID